MDKYPEAHRYPEIIKRYIEAVLRGDPDWEHTPKPEDIFPYRPKTLDVIYGLSLPFSNQPLARLGKMVRDGAVEIYLTVNEKVASDFEKFVRGERYDTDTAKQMLKGLARNIRKKRHKVSSEFIDRRFSQIHPTWGKSSQPMSVRVMEMACSTKERKTIDGSPFFIPGNQPPRFEIAIGLPEESYKELLDEIKEHPVTLGPKETRLHGHGGWRLLNIRTKKIWVKRKVQGIYNVRYEYVPLKVFVKDRLEKFKAGKIDPFRRPIP